MTYREALSNVRKQAALSQREVAAELYVERSTLSKMELGGRAVSPDVMRRANELFDDPRLLIESQGEVANGAAVPWLNNVDLHRAAVHIKSVEEIEEAMLAIKSGARTLMKQNDQLSEAEKELVKQAIMESIEAITALTHYAAVLCQTYEFSWTGMWRDHRKHLKSKLYIKD